MVNLNPYAQEKLMQFERERRFAEDRLPRERPRRRTVFGPFAALAGRSLRLAGEWMEGWAFEMPTEEEAGGIAARGGFPHSRE